VLEFVIAHYIIFIVIAIVLLLGLFGYIMDRRKYKEYRDEILKDTALEDSLMSAPELSNVAKHTPTKK
jgi:hypothetical protein